MCEWLPIESAPKDGTQIILACFYLHPKSGEVCYIWVADGYLDGDLFTFSSIMADENEHNAPTHWMPLVSPPAIT